MRPSSLHILTVVRTGGVARLTGRIYCCGMILRHADCCQSIVHKPFTTANPTLMLSALIAKIVGAVLNGLSIDQMFKV